MVHPQSPDRVARLIFRPVELLRKLAALVPHPRCNLVVFHGVLAGNHRWRSMVVPPRPPSSEEEGPPRRRRRSGWIPWYELMKRTFGVSVLRVLVSLRESLEAGVDAPCRAVVRVEAGAR